uniref:G_PROTEIN_RECEP_F1_2 domain-containing protein n=1 Tax=Caenorhabditis tropicalis TaxID=1561998 RepID=A0A1I7UF14_9PELO
MPKNHTSKTSTTEEPFYIPLDYEYEEDTYKKVFNISTRINLSLQLATVFFNTLHLIILFRKDLRSIAIYILMIGICISDILTNSLDFINAAGEIQWLPILFAGSGEMSCVKDGYQEVNIPAQAVATVIDISRRLSVWLAILMAAIRTLSVWFPMNQRVQGMTKTRGALWTLLACTVFWIVFNTWHFALYRILWLPDNASQFCLSMSMFKHLITPKYVLVAPEGLQQSMLDWGFIEAVMKFSAAVSYPILTVSLLIQLRIIKKRRQNLQKKEGEQGDNTTKLILFMTICFMLSEGLAGVEAVLLYNIDKIMEKYEDLGNAIITAQYPIGILRTINALSHPFVCFLLSSQYRDTVKGIFIVKRKVGDYFSDTVTQRFSGQKSGRNTVDESIEESNDNCLEYI